MRRSLIVPYTGAPWCIADVGTAVTFNAPTTKWEAVRGKSGEKPGTAGQKRNHFGVGFSFPMKQAIFAVASREWNYQDMTEPIKLTLEDGSEIIG